jgi:AmmeMemoRadiSam system protein A
MGAVDQIKEKDLAGFSDYVQETKATICGRHAIGVLLAMLPAESRAHLLHYDTSGRISGDYSNTVSYCSIAFTGKWPPGKPVAVKSQAARLTDGDKRQLLKLARRTLQYALKHRWLPTPEQLKIQLTPNMKTVWGAFVTLKKDGRLRGCIGEIYPTRPLYKAVMVHTINAATADRRFQPVDASEIPELKFEISALTPPRPVATAEAIIIGTHGIVLAQDGQTAVFLPQVAVEQGWDRDETLAHLARKAGLPPEAWNQGAALSVFEAVVFGEGDE